MHWQLNRTSSLIAPFSSTFLGQCSWSSRWITQGRTRLAGVANNAPVRWVLSAHAKYVHPRITLSIISPVLAHLLVDARFFRLDYLSNTAPQSRWCDTDILLVGGKHWIFKLFGCIFLFSRYESAFFPRLNKPAIKQRMKTNILLFLSVFCLLFENDSRLEVWRVRELIKSGKFCDLMGFHKL